ncbi:MAG: CoA ester lyase [Gammaproteobacteria bacterium]|nr:MAG: CoA ester lyase [Gammaproteobacteria bacterium]
MQTFRADAQESRVNRSFLFVPADSERKLAKARDSAADALILDLEDSVASAARPQARQIAREFIADKPQAELWLRINPLATADALADLREVLPAAPAGIVLPKAGGVDDVLQLAQLLDELEREHGLAAGSTAIMPIATETPAAVLRLHGYQEAGARLTALTWGAEDLSAVLGASATRDAAGEWLGPYALARSLCLLAATAAGAIAVDTVFTDFRDSAGLTRYAGNAQRDGFAAMLAIHPAQVDIINAAFVPDAASVARAQRIVALFAANPQAGTLGMDGEMIDRPHLLQAEKILRQAGQQADQHQ